MKRETMFGRLMSSLTMMLIAIVVMAFAAMLGAKPVFATTVSKSFTTHSQASNPLLVYGGESFTFTVSGTFVGTVKLQRSTNGSDYRDLTPSVSTTGALTRIVYGEGPTDRVTYYRVYASTHTSGTIVTSLADVNDLVQTFRNRKGVDNLQLYDDGVIVPGTLAVTGTSALTGVITAPAQNVITLQINTTTQLSARADPPGTLSLVESCLNGTPVTTVFGMCYSTAANISSYVWKDTTTAASIGTACR